MTQERRDKRARYQWQNGREDTKHACKYPPPSQLIPVHSPRHSDLVMVGPLTTYTERRSHHRKRTYRISPSTKESTAITHGRAIDDFLVRDTVGRVLREC